MLDTQADAFGYFYCTGEIIFREKDDEFFSTITADQVYITYTGKRKLGNFAEHLITYLVAVAIVELLEIIDIQKNGRDRAFEALNTPDFILAKLEQSPAVIQTCEGIYNCQVLHFGV